MRLLIVEDEKYLMEALAKGLRKKGYSVDCAKDGEEGYEKIIDEGYDLIILDLNLPKIDGLTLLSLVSKEKSNLKVIILSANSDIEYKLKGFNFGASDYMLKPFHFEELEVRIRLLLHREYVQKSKVLQLGNLKLNTLNRKIFNNDKEVTFTSKETALFEYFLLNKERLISQQELIEHVWDESVDIFSNSVRVHMSALRKKIKKELGYDPIETKIGEGYLLNEKNELTN